MASVTLTRVYISDGLDLADKRSFYSERPDDERSIDGEVRRYLGGRERVITRAGRSQTLDLTLVDVSDADVAWLDAHMGRLVLVRDTRGRGVWGTYFSITPEDYADYNAAVSLTVKSVSHSLAV